MSTASESHSPSRGNGLTGVLSKARRGRKGNTTDTASTVSNGSDGSLNLRGKLGGTVDKLKYHDGSDNDDGESGRLSKLIPKGIGSMRRRKKEDRDAEQRASEEAARGRSVAERGTLENNNGSYQLPADGDGSSLITYESENEGYTSTPPPLSTHASHIGYLTTSSPLIQAAALPEGTRSDLQLDGALQSSEFPIETNHPAITQSSPEINAKSLRPGTSDSSKRSPSPVGRLREAFTSHRGGSTSPERKTGSPGSLDPGILEDKYAGREGRRGSVASRIGAIFPSRGVTQINSASTMSQPETIRATRVPQHIDTNARPQTPPTVEGIAPVIVNTPPTPTDLGSSQFVPTRERGTSEPTSSVNTNVVTSPSGNMISHRRVRTNSVTLGPSKLSNITSAPLTPTPETVSTSPGQNPQSGFFSSVFSAAQNAANTLTNSISNTSLAPGQKKKEGGTQELKNIENVMEKSIDDVEVETVGEQINLGEMAEEKEPAVKTLGMGDLSLSHLGISEPYSMSNTPTTARFPDAQEERGRSDSAGREDSFASRATLVGESIEIPPANPVEDLQFLARPRSVYESRLGGDQTPPNGSVLDTKAGITRSGSIRSAFGDRRKRGGSATTGTTIGAAIVAANASVAHPAAQGSTPKLTGFAVASKKRNRDFHQLFRSVPDDDYLIEDYSCALQREILAHGRLYVSEGHLCFSSNIFGWVTTLVMSFDEIVSVEKRSTALVFKNGLMISTLHAKNIFASFTSRDSTYDLIVGIWKLGHPSLQSSLNGVKIDEAGGGDKTEKIDGNGSQSGSGSEDESEEGDVYDEDEEDEDGMSFTQAVEGSISGSDGPDKSASRKPSAAVTPSNGVAPEKSKETSPTTTTSDFPGPATHAPTECNDKESHYEIILADELIPAPLGKIYDLIFGPASVSWMSKWITNEQKCLEFTTDDKTGLTKENKVRLSSYIKPLYASIGPKQTKCIATDTLDFLDLEKAVSVTISTQTPDVPSGNVFSTKTHYCLTWGPGNSTRLQMNCSIEWTGKSWLKGPIEKGAKDGQTQYAKDIIASLKAAVSSRRPTEVSAGKSKKKSRKEKSRSAPGEIDGASDSKHIPPKEDWGLLEPLHGPLGPIFDILKPLVSGNMVYGLLVGLLVAAWFSFGYTNRGRASKDISFFAFNTPERIAAYEEMWRREESELWNWLEERVGMDRVHSVKTHLNGDQAKSIEDKLRQEKVSEREIDVAIRVTRDKLEALERMVLKSKADKIGKSGKVRQSMQASGDRDGEWSEDGNTPPHSPGPN